MSKAAEASTLNATITAANVGIQFMDIMDDYMKRQDDDPNFDGHHELYDLYDALSTLYFNNNE